MPLPACPSGGIFLFGAGWSSPVARQAHNLKVAGSNPAPATNRRPGLVSGFFVSASCATEPFPKRYCRVTRNTNMDPGPWWTVQRGGGPIVATAIHDGHGLRPDVAAAMKLPDADRLREE